MLLKLFEVQEQSVINLFLIKLNHIGKNWNIANGRLEKSNERK